MEDDCVCEYDSTWDTESDGDDPAGESQTRRSSQDKNKSGWTLVTWHHTPRNMRAAKDMQNYRRGYPNLTDDECSEDKMNNLQFYLNKFPSAPDDVYIESFLKEWKNDYKRLERVHSYIQWLFPLREPGVNYMASELTKKEIEAFKKNEDAKRRLVESYELMLGFYGIRLVNKETGEVKRADNWKERFGNLERNMHNNLRITRILKSLGELGFEHYQAPLVRFFLEETLVKKTLSSVKRSVLDYFLFAVLDKRKRQELVRFAYLHFEPKDKFVWCPRKIQKQFRKAEKRSDAVGNGDGKEEVYSRSKSKDGEVVVQQKEEGLDSVTKAQKGADKTVCKDKIESEASPEPKQDAETVGNGNAEAESNNDNLGNGNDSTDDADEMDQSPSPESVTSKPEPCADSEEKFTNNSKDGKQEPDNIMQTDGDIDTEKPPKKKREDNKVLPSNGSAGDLDGGGQMEEKAGANKASGQMSPSSQTPLKTSKHSPSLSSGREEKIPRTDFNQVPDKKEEEETSLENVSATNGSETSTDKGVEEQANGKESEDADMESNPSSSDQNMGNS
ncbi:opioid growth factor receptor-like protein 1 [Cheilinus undulatus]|uniref:opioid growth factor receptor-like protein 1 n=1 Tax=Cheilinus undulatus TaxID=241271 RepID=UPI001BD1E90F|nr:opioid growth factor receptor-like protein 1 [Cheilinus undulatus]